MNTYISIQNDTIEGRYSVTSVTPPTTSSELSQIAIIERQQDFRSSNNNNFRFYFYYSTSNSTMSNPTSATLKTTNAKHTDPRATMDVHQLGEATNHCFGKVVLRQAIENKH